MAASLSDYLAAERTFLAWIRTGLALAGFGFVIARFGLFLRAAGLEHGGSRLALFGSPWIGAALILLGALALVWSAWHYIRLTGALGKSEAEIPHRSSLAVALAVLLGIMALALAIHLMPAAQAAVQPIQEVHMSQGNGIVTIASRHSVDETVQRLEGMLAAKGVKVFALVDHSGEALKAGFEMRPCKLLIFGNPKAGTPLMLASPSAALDLPLKILVWEKPDGTAVLSYNDPTWLRQRHALPGDLMGNISVVEALAAKAAGF